MKGRDHPRYARTNGKHASVTSTTDEKSGHARVCRAPDCGMAVKVAGYCPRHYQQVRRHGRLTPERARDYARMKCQVRGCQDKHAARGYL